MYPVPVLATRGLSEKSGGPRIQFRLALAPRGGSLAPMVKPKPDFTLETDAMAKGQSPVAGVDEVGRGPLAGPVVAAAVILSPDAIPEGMNDSKLLSAKARDALVPEIYASADVGVGVASVAEIDDLNILRASHLAMVRAIHALRSIPALALVDGNQLPRDLPCPGTTVIKGDSKSLSIAAASIVAKCLRDKTMVDLAQQHPGYGWETNMGYPSLQHREALKSHGVTPHHRR